MRELILEQTMKTEAPTTKESVSESIHASTGHEETSEMGSKATNSARKVVAQSDSVVVVVAVAVVVVVVAAVAASAG